MMDVAADLETLPSCLPLLFFSTVRGAEARPPLPLLRDEEDTIADANSGFASGGGSDETKLEADDVGT